MSRLTHLYLSNNLLNGSIPSSIGKIDSLRILHLSNNHLSEKVHDRWMGEKIEAIYLSKNKLSSSFPASPIPSGNQFLTFDESIYEGNQGLYGSPLPIKCEAPTVEKYGAHQGLDEENSEDKYENFRLFVSIALGFIVGFWTLCGSLVIKKSRRDSYFGFLKNVKAWIVMVVSVIVKRLQRMIAKDGN
ncbi:hypothetical protein LguiB_010149 [Lonicera macranthoides]